MINQRTAADGRLIPPDILFRNARKRRILLSLGAGLILTLLPVEKSPGQVSQPTPDIAAFGIPGAARTWITVVNAKASLMRGSEDPLQHLTCGPAANNGGPPPYANTDEVAIEFSYGQPDVGRVIGSWKVVGTQGHVIFKGVFTGGAVNLTDRNLTGVPRGFVLRGKTVPTNITPCVGSEGEKTMEIAGTHGPRAGGVVFKVMEGDRIFASGTFKRDVKISAGKRPRSEVNETFDD